MPINIQEILYPNDSDSIKWEKVNYNFDQIISTGGKEGPKGEKGSTGTTGLLGLQGDKGEKGDFGEKGETGTSTNYWEQFASTTQNITSYVIKPKNGTGDDQAAIIIGDSSYDEGNTDGYLDPSAQLTVYTDSYSYSQKWGPTSGSDFLTFRGESATIYGASGTKWIIQPEGQGTNTEILINSQLVNISSDGNVGIDSSGDVEVTGNGATNIYNDGADISGYLDVAGAANFSDYVSINSTSYLKIPSGTTTQRDISEFTSSAGMLRYNNSTNKFEGYTGTWRDFQRLSNSQKSVYVSVEQDADYTLSEGAKINLVAQGNKMVSVSSTEVKIKNTTGTDIFKTSNTRIDAYLNAYTTQNIFLENKNKGVVFPEGLNQSALPSNANAVYFKAGNNGSTTGQRTFQDYFERGNYTPTTPLLNISNTTEVTISSTNYSSSDFKVNYTKVGNLITVFGEYEFIISNFSSYSNYFGFDLGTEFAYTNSSNIPIIVNIEVDYFQMDRGSAPTGDLPYTYFGLIEPGENFIKMYWRNSGGGQIVGQTLINGYVSTSEEVNTDDLSAYALIGSGSIPTVIRFNFQMPTGVESYQSSISLSSQVFQGGNGNA
jgi:hypothetical protein